MFSLFLRHSYREKWACRDNIKRDRKDVASDLEPDERRHMMCPSNPPARQDSSNTPAFFLFLVFTSISLCNISAWSRLLWPTVSLFGLSWRGVFTLYFLTSLLPVRKVECSLRILSLFISDCLCIPLTFAQINLSCSCFFFFCQALFQVDPLCNYLFPFSIAFACIFLYFRETLLYAGHGVLPSVQERLEKHLLFRPF